MWETLTTKNPRDLMHSLWFRLDLSQHVSLSCWGFWMFYSFKALCTPCTLQSNLKSSQGQNLKLHLFSILLLQTCDLSFLLLRQTWLVSFKQHAAALLIGDGKLLLDCLETNLQILWRYRILAAAVSNARFLCINSDHVQIIILCSGQGLCF